ncbi:hypothetical protein DL96DRAFT_1587092 [Flagelloscypha sp. PMI_526]|nr:hypothetical protein DL96DRAFT_1587092 [Flagelloscypha sp. PMI_526]
MSDSTGISTPMLHGVPMSNFRPAMPNFVDAVGPYFIGCILDMFCQAIIFVLFLRYLAAHCKDDGKWMRGVVVFLFLLTVLKSMQLFYLAWTVLVQNFGSLREATLFGETNWTARSTPLVVSILCIYVQGFFVYRLWGISKSIILPVIILTLSIVSMIGSILVLVYKTNSPKQRSWVYVHLTTLCASDLILTSSLMFYLWRSKKEVSIYAVGAVEALLRTIFLTALPGTLCALVSVILCSQTSSDVHQTIAVHQAIPKLFVISMLWTLNARGQIRDSVALNNEGNKTWSDASQIVFRTEGKEPV